MSRKPTPPVVAHWSSSGTHLAPKVVFNREHWTVFSWDKRARVVTLVNPESSVCLLDPPFMQWIDRPKRLI